jgi:BlaI family transcriptional regulator, penicillinase repressor
VSERNRSELEAMRILWDGGPLKPSEIQAEFSWPIENATLRSVLRALMDKGDVKRRRKGKAFYYQANASREGLLAGMVRQMAHVFSGGSSANLIMQLIETERLSPKEIEELRRAAGRVATKKGPESDPGT